MSCNTSRDATKQLFTSPENRHIFKSDIQIDSNKLKEFENLAKGIADFAENSYKLKNIGLPFTHKNVGGNHTIQYNNSFFLSVDKFHNSKGELASIGNSYPNNIKLVDFEDPNLLVSSSVKDGLSSM